MKLSTAGVVLAGMLVVFVNSSWAQSAAPPPTLWNFLGIPQGFQNARAQMLNRRGNTPGLERRPPLKNIADPANLESDVPAIKAAAEMKQAEDLKPQKIKAIKYLAKIGCGCYDKDEKVTKALLAAMEDCTEDVRLAAVEAISDAAGDGCQSCPNCDQRSCCNEKITEQLATIAYERDENGCFVEPSERVREAAAEALAACCPYRGPVMDEREIEGDLPTPRIEGSEDNPPLPPPPAEDSLIVPPSDDTAARSPRFAPQFASSPIPRQFSSRRTARMHNVSRSTTPPAAAPSVAPHGAVMLIDPSGDRAHVHFTEDSPHVAVGSRLQVYVPGESGYQIAGELEVMQSFPDSAHVRPVNGLVLSTIQQGALVVHEGNLLR